MISIDLRRFSSCWHRRQRCARPFFTNSSTPANGRSAQNNSEPGAWPNYVGDATCISCPESENRNLSPHRPFPDFAAARCASILGSLTPARNAVKTSNPDRFFRMDQKGNEFFQTAIEGETPFNHRTR
jgi:hypothetical protein